MMHVEKKLEIALEKFCKRNLVDRTFVEEQEIIDEILIENNFDTFFENYILLYNLDTALLDLDYSIKTRKKLLTEINMALCYD